LILSAFFSYVFGGATVGLSPIVGLPAARPLLQAQLPILFGLHERYVPFYTR
jgi:hypothetical protein